MNVYVLLSVSIPSLLRRRSCVCECVCPLSVSLPSLGHVFVNVYVLLSVSLPSLLRRRSFVCECVCPFVSEPSKLTLSKVMCL